jgi:16S rRNA (uracil1498-N3)-methyltransferase
MHRFYVDRVDGERVAITDAGQLHHLKDVLRLKTGGKVVICDNDGKTYDGVIDGIDRKQVIFKVIESKSVPGSKTKLTIACAIPKGDRMDDIIDQLTQLGVERIIPMMTERVIVKLNNTRKESRLKRWKTIAQNAAQQSQRNSIPHIEPVTEIANVLSDSGNFDLKIIPHLGGETIHIRDLFNNEQPEKILILIGPEGDFTPQEVELALGAGFIPVSLGDTILRVATAATAVASFLKLTYGQ